MNVYEMYYNNGKKFPYFIQRSTWGKTLAKVISIENTIDGKDIPGKAPYFGNPKVMAEFYTFNTHEECSIDNCTTENLDNVSEVRSPGNYSYYLIEKV